MSFYFVISSESLGDVTNGIKSRELSLSYPHSLLIGQKSKLLLMPLWSDVTGDPYIQKGCYYPIASVVHRQPWAVILAHSMTHRMDDFLWSQYLEQGFQPLVNLDLVCGHAIC